jgi:Tol biopolymer transport system component
MRELLDRFEALSRTPTPDLWSAIESRQPHTTAELSASRRMLVAVVALAVAVAGVGFAAISLGGSDRPAASGTPGPMGSANGPIYFRVGGGDGASRIEAVEPDGSGRRVVFEGEPTRIAQIAWSPDGGRIAYQDPVADERGIFVANADGSDAVRLTDGINDAWPSWSPDGSKIVFTSSRYDSSIELCEPGAEFRCPTDVYVMDSHGTNVTRLTSDPAPEYQPVWSPDGRRIAFVRSSGGSGGEAPLIFTMDADGLDVQQVSSGDGGSDFSPSWSPDGSQIVFLGFRFEATGIWIAAATARTSDGFWVRVGIR